VTSAIPRAGSTPQTLLKAIVFRFVNQQPLSTFCLTESMWQLFNTVSFPRGETETRETMQLARRYKTWGWHIDMLNLTNFLYFYWPHHLYQETGNRCYLQSRESRGLWQKWTQMLHLQLPGRGCERVATWAQKDRESYAGEDQPSLGNPGREPQGSLPILQICPTQKAGGMGTLNVVPADQPQWQTACGRGSEEIWRVRIKMSLD
jgi:hypothetical protein